MKRLLLLVFLLSVLPITAFATINGETCKPFYDVLKEPPHESIFQREGAYNSRFFETTAVGCFLVMNTSEALLAGTRLPDLSGRPGSVFYNAGWRSNPKYLADGPGTGVVGLEKGEALCLVFYEQPAHLDDKGQVVQSEFIKVRVECMEGRQGKSPKIILRERKP